MHLFYKLIQSKRAAIDRGDFSQDVASAISQSAYRQWQWLGLAFERFCLFHHQAIARILGFSGVRYEFGNLVPLLRLIFEKIGSTLVAWLIER